jgi:hypothetical protein
MEEREGAQPHYAVEKGFGCLIGAHEIVNERTLVNATVPEVSDQVIRENPASRGTEALSK